MLFPFGCMYERDMRNKFWTAAVFTESPLNSVFSLLSLSFLILTPLFRYCPTCWLVLTLYLHKLHKICVDEKKIYCITPANILYCFSYLSKLVKKMCCLKLFSYRGTLCCAPLQKVLLAIQSLRKIQHLHFGDKSLYLWSFTGIQR